MKASKKEIYSSRGGFTSTATNGNGDKLDESLQSVFELALESHGPERMAKLLEKLAGQLRTEPRPMAGQNTPDINTIPVEQQPAYPGDRDIERRIKSMIRWNAMAMVVKANSNTNVGGHIASFASSATLYEVAQNHFFRGATENFPGDQVYFQGHAAPGMYARAFMEGRLDEQQTGLVALDDVVPLGSPNDLDDVPARATEKTFEFLDNFSISAHRAVEPL